MELRAYHCPYLTAHALLPPGVRKQNAAASSAPSPPSWQRGARYYLATTYANTLPRAAPAATPKHKPKPEYRYAWCFHVQHTEP